MNDVWEYWNVEVLSMDGTAELSRQMAWAGGQGWELVFMTPIVGAHIARSAFGAETRMIILTFKRRVAGQWPDGSGE